MVILILHDLDKDKEISKFDRIFFRHVVLNGNKFLSTKFEFLNFFILEFENFFKGETFAVFLNKIFQDLGKRFSMRFRQNFFSAL
jgi:hypothetical protein